MFKPAVFAAAALVVLVACQSLGVEGFVAELRARGLPAEIKGEFNGLLLDGQGTSLCIGDESLSIYGYPDAGAAQKAAATINRDDPSNIGNALVEWVGPPRFWLRDRLIIQYTGPDAALDGALRNILGPPFAEAKGWGAQPPFERSCQEPVR